MSMCTSAGIFFQDSKSVDFLQFTPLDGDRSE